MTLLMDTPYLEQLKLSSERLQGIIPAVNPFATYTMGAETAPPSIQGVPQNYFDPMTGQFMMPDLQLSETTSTDGNIPASYGTYTPAPFGASATNEVIPGLMSNAMTGRQGGGEGDALGQFSNVQGINDPLSPANKQRYSYESLNGRTFRVDNVTGEVEEANMPFGTASLLGTFANAIPGVQDYRLANMTPEDRQKLQMANAIAINRAAAFNPQNPATTDAVEGTGSGAVGSTGPTARSGRDNRGGVGDRNAPGGSAAAGANRGGAAGARS
jgi:hypothetical protein